MLLGALVAGLAFAAPGQAATFVALTDDNQLRRLDSATPSSLGPSLTITGLQTGETILGIDFRPQNNQLFGIGTTSRLYQIDPNTGAATQVGSPGGFTLSGTDFGVDFNPAVDRLRVVSDAEQNLRLNPNDGTLAGSDSPLAYGMGDPNFGVNPNVVGSAYTNNFLGATSTTLYGIDSGQDVLTMQNPPDTGQLSTIGPLGFNFSGMTGFDVLDDGSAFAVMDAAGASTSVFYSLNLATGQAAVLGTLPDDLRGLAGEPTGAAGPFTGQLNRLDGNQMLFDVTNGGMRRIEFLALELMDGFTVNQVDIVSGRSAQCDPIPQSSAAQCGPFPGPIYWDPASALQILVETDNRYPDGGGVDLFVCPAPCAPFFRDDGPFSFGGPFAVQQPPGPGGPGGGPSGGGLPGDFDLNGAVDLNDLARVLAAFGGEGVTIRIETPDGVVEGDGMSILAEVLANFGRSSAAQRRRPRPKVIARRRTTLRAPQAKRVRLPLTKAGKRLHRQSKPRKRIRATLRLKVTYRPASGAASQTRTFRGPVRLRVVKPRPRR